jgi:cytochrome b6-f complex iron-sulfur subunit
MAEKISELSGDEREKRVAELKAKMQAAAKRQQAAHAEGGKEEAPAAAAAPARAAATATAAPARTAPKPSAVPATESKPSGGNGASAPAISAPPRPAPRPAPKPRAEEAEAPALTPAEMTRREFLTYAWGAALGLLTLEIGYVSFVFMYPRFREGEFGGIFRLDQAVPDPTAPPDPNTIGKFWLVATPDGEPKALYMVCTHLGCLYKWEPANFRFECPCHGSKFSHDGFYIEGPAPRSLDYFDVTIEGGQIIVDTGKRTVGDPAAESPARAVPI